MIYLCITDTSRARQRAAVVGLRAVVIVRPVGERQRVVSFEIIKFHKIIEYGDKFAY